MPNKINVKSFARGGFMRISEIERKEVINVCDGCRLGCVCDVEIDIKTGFVKKLIIPAKGKFFGLFGCALEYHICWNDIKCIGDDLILVCVNIDDIIVEC